MLWEWITAFLTAIGSILGSVWAIKAVVRHEEKVCDTRLEEFKEGLSYREKDS